MGIGIRVFNFEETCSPQIVINFTRQITVMLECGTPLAEALKILSHQPESEEFASAVEEISRSVGAGKELRDSFASYQHFFSPVYLAMLEIGVRTGRLGECLDHLAIWLERDVGLRRKLRLAMTYPCLILALSFALGVVLCCTVLPKFVEIFAALDCDLPWPTRILIFVMAVLKNPGFWLISLGLSWGAWGFCRDVWTDPKGKRQLTSWLLALPIVGRLMRHAALARFCHAASIGTAAGMDVVTTLRLGALASDNAVLDWHIDEAWRAVADGDTIHEALARHSEFFDQTLVGMLFAGEESARLAEVFEQAGEVYVCQLDSELSNFTKLAEPVLLMGVAAVVGSILLAVFLPLYSYLGEL